MTVETIMKKNKNLCLTSADRPKRVMISINYILHVNHSGQSKSHCTWLRPGGKASVGGDE